MAIFDADSAPPPDFLRRTLPAFRDPEVGLVQVRWEFSNAARTLLGRLQALILDGLFAVEQHVRAARRLPLQFNGTNGIWRRSSLEEVAPWRGDVLTEDAEISVRAQLRGWRLVHRRFGVAVSTVMHPENTRGLSAFVQQALEEL